MAKRISELDDVPSDLDVSSGFLPVAHNGANFKVPLNQLGKFLNKAALGLDRVDNTSDLEKPVSIPVATALNQKADKTHSHSASQIVDLDQAVVRIVSELVLDGEGSVVFSGSEW